MNANVLRIGNFVNAINKRHSEKYIKVESISSDFINQDFRLYHVSDLVPLELTTDWILKGGFEKFDRKFIFENDTKYFIELDLEQRYCLRIKISKDYSAFICELEHVHQLQNIMFAIRGEELVF